MASSRQTVPGFPAIRITECNDAPLQPGGRYVLYWMIAARRLSYNFALDRALGYCRQFDKPLLILEALRCGYRWASDRVHRFVLDGMTANALEATRRGVRYFPYIEPSPGAGCGLLETLAGAACVVITDDFPCFFLRRMVATASKKLHVRLEAVDSNGLLPLRVASQLFTRAVDFRRFLQNALGSYLSEPPSANPFARRSLPAPPVLRRNITSKWPPATSSLLAGEPAALAALPIDHSVATTQLRGGHPSAQKLLDDFLDRKLAHYAENHNEPELDGASGLSPYLHFGHLSVHEVFTALAKREQWSPRKLQIRATGKREGWWNMSPSAESFLDQIVTWRELGFNFCAHRQNYDQFDSLPDWARRTLAQHARDERRYLYTLRQFESAQTHDQLWNAAQTQLIREGRIHNYLRMLWGKKILEWSSSPQEALATMIHLNNKYALDGRDPNSYSGIFWVLGRYDHPWPPERPIFGTVRYMSSENTRRKFSVQNYIRRYSPDSDPAVTARPTRNMP